MPHVHELTFSARRASAVLQVRDTGTARGNGAFASEHIAAGTLLGEYEGELLDLDDFYARYPDGVVRSWLKEITIHWF